MIATVPPDEPQPVLAHNQPDWRRLVEVLTMGFVGSVMVTLWGGDLRKVVCPRTCVRSVWQWLSAVSQD